MILDICLLYTSDAADEEDSVDLGGRRIIKMSTDIAESLPKRKFAPAAMAKPKAKAEAPAAKGGSGKGASEEGSEKKIRQAVYDLSLIHI